VVATFKLVDIEWHEEVVPVSAGKRRLQM